MTEETDVPWLADREIPKLVDLALTEVSEGLKTTKQYLLYFLTQIPTAVYEKIRDKVVPEAYLSPNASTDYQMKCLMRDGVTEKACRFAEVWIRILEKSSVVDKVSLILSNKKSQKITILGRTKDFELPNIVNCLSNPTEKFVVNGHTYSFSPKNHPTMYLATVIDQPIEKPKPIVTQKDVDDIMNDKDRIREKLDKFLNISPQSRAERKKPPYHLVVNIFDMNAMGDQLYIVVFNSNIERHTIVYTGWLVLKDIMLLDAFYTDADLFKFWYT